MLRLMSDRICRWWVVGKDSGGDGGNARNRHFSSEGRVSQDLRRRVEITTWVSRDNHYTFLRVATGCLSSV